MKIKTKSRALPIYRNGYLIEKVIGGFGFYKSLKTALQQNVCCDLC